MGSFQQVLLVGRSLGLPAIGPVTGIDVGCGGTGIPQLPAPPQFFVYNHISFHIQLFKG